MLNLHVAKQMMNCLSDYFQPLLCDSSSFMQLVTAPLFQVSLNE